MTAAEDGSNDISVEAFSISAPKVKFDIIPPFPPLLDELDTEKSSPDPPTFVLNLSKKRLLVGGSE